MRIIGWLDKIANDRTVERQMAWLREAHARMDAAVPDGAVVFLGDSNTFTLVAAAVAPIAVNFGMGALRSDQLLDFLPTYRCLARAAAVSIMVGTNDIFDGRAEGLEDRYAAILAKIPAGIPVVFSSVPPLAVNPDQARRASVALRAVCEDDWRCRFVDLHAALDGAPDALTPDGVHLSETGYAVWIRLLREALGS
jgi:lysophospholipase L1-like esterase